MNRRVWKPPKEVFHRLTDGSSIVGLFFAHSPDDHPVWDNYVLPVVHLRDTEEHGEAFKKDPEATHEIMLFVASPGVELPGGDSAGDPRLQLSDLVLGGANAGVQYRAGGDELAVARAYRSMLRAPSLDSDYFSWWEEEYKDGWSMRL